MYFPPPHTCVLNLQLQNKNIDKCVDWHFNHGLSLISLSYFKPTLNLQYTHGACLYTFNLSIESRRKIFPHVKFLSCSFYILSLEIKPCSTITGLDEIKNKWLIYILFIYKNPYFRHILVLTIQHGNSHSFQMHQPFSLFCVISTVLTRKKIKNLCHVPSLTFGPCFSSLLVWCNPPSKIMWDKNI